MENNKTFLKSLFLVVIAIILIFLINMRGNVIVVTKRLDKLPCQIGQWSCREAPLQNEIVEELDTDVYISRTYYPKTSNSNPISLYIGYYGTGKGGRTGHNPYACLPSQGKAITKEKKVTLNVSIDKNKKKDVTLTQLIVRGDDTITQVLYHWYQSSGSDVLDSGIQQNLDRLWKRTLLNRNDGAFVQVSTVVSDNIEVADKAVQAFIKELFPQLVKFWPVESDSIS